MKRQIAIEALSTALLNHFGIESDFDTYTLVDEVEDLARGVMVEFVALHTNGCDRVACIEFALAGQTKSGKTIPAFSEIVMCDNGELAAFANRKSVEDFQANGCNDQDVLDYCG